MKTDVTRMNTNCNTSNTTSIRTKAYITPMNLLKFLVQAFLTFLILIVLLEY